MSYTTIQITSETKHKLAQLKSDGRETYDELINALIELIPSKDDEGTYTNEFRASLLRGLLDIRRGRTYSDEEVRKKLGIE